MRAHIPLLAAVLIYLQPLAAASPATRPTASSLVREIQQSELWFDRLTTFRLRAESRWTRTPASLESSRREYKSQFPDLQPTTRNFPDLAPESTDTFELAAAPGHLRKEESRPSLSGLYVWDGKRQLSHTRTPDGRERYSISPKAYVASNFHTNLNWGRTADHSYWWLSLEGRSHTNGHPKPDHCTLDAQAQYRGTDCYVISDHVDGYTLYVGTADHRLYGRKTSASGGDYIEEWFADYRDLAPGCSFPLSQGYSLFDTNSPDHHLESTRNIRFTTVELNPRLDDALFTLDIPEGAPVDDFVRNISYTQKKDRTPAEWQQLLSDRAAQDAEIKAATDAQDALVGHPAPAFPKDAQWLNSPGVLSWPDLKGRVVLIDFFADWCGPCRADLPTLSNLHNQSKETGITILAIHPPGSPRASIDKILNDFHLSYPICIDTPDPNNVAWGALYAQYHVNAIPHTFVIDRNGNIAAHGDLSQTLPIARKLAAP